MRSASASPVLGHPLARKAGVHLDGTIEDGDVVSSGDLEIRAIATPGHCRDHLALLVNGTDCLTADCLFRGHGRRGTAGGGPTGYEDQLHSIMERLMALPPETRIHPGHKEPSTVRRRVGDEPVHPRLARPRPRGRGALPGRRRGRRRSSSGGLTTTARTRRSSSTRTAAAQSSAARVWSAPSGGLMTDGTEERRYLEPGWFMRRVANPVVMRLGLATRLAVRGRKSGRWYEVPVNVLELDGERYLVAVRGETDWVRNVRATGGGELRRGSSSEPFRTVEVSDDEKPRIIDAYLAPWARQVKGLFAALPDPADHPVFRVVREP